MQRWFRRIREGAHSGRPAGRSDMLSSLCRDEGGGVAIIFALTAFIALTLVGGAVDYGRASTSYAKIQSVIDAASLAAVGSYMADPAHDKANAVAVADRYLAQSLGGFDTLALQSTFDEASRTMRITADVKVRTPFLSLAGITTLSLSAYAEASASEGNAGGGSNNDVEMALMLDVTGSMGADDGTGQTKIQALQSAARTMIDIMLPDAGPAHAKLALAPFARTVKLSDAQITAATGLPLTKDVCTATSTVCENTTCAEFRRNGSCRRWNQSCMDVCTQSETTHLRRCVVERRGDAMLTDEAPAAGRYIPALIPASDDDEYSSSLSSAQSCTPNQPIVALTSSKTNLKATVDQFSANGSTAGWLGTAWAWYMLSPEWSGVFPGDAAPKPYGTSRLKKIAVLMTDGEYNTENGVNTGDAATISANAMATCGAMKTKGVEIYTIGFKLDNQLARDTLQACATDASHAFLAENAAQLTAAFREIAFRSVPLRLTR